MIEIKQDRLLNLRVSELLDRVVLMYAADAVMIGRGQLPTLISHLIEIGGVSKGLEVIPRDVSHDDAAAWICEHYHLVPKSKL